MEIVLIIIVTLAVFFVARGIVLWYWKVWNVLENQEEIIKQQKITNDLLKQQLEVLKNKQPQ